MRPSTRTSATPRARLYRGLHLTEDDLARQFSGGVYTEKGFGSTATGGRVAGFSGNTQLVINSRGSGKKVVHLAQVEAEREVTIVPGTRFKVLKIVTVDGKHTIYLDEILDLPVPVPR
jgi:hypothetical protein